MVWFSVSISSSFSSSCSCSFHSLDSSSVMRWTSAWYLERTVFELVLDLGELGGQLVVLDGRLLELLLGLCQLRGRCSAVRQLSLCLLQLRANTFQLSSRLVELCLCGVTLTCQCNNLLLQLAGFEGICFDLRSQLRVLLGQTLNLSQAGLVRGFEVWQHLLPLLQLLLQRRHLRGLAVELLLQSSGNAGIRRLLLCLLQVQLQLLDLLSERSVLLCCVLQLLLQLAAVRHFGL